MKAINHPNLWATALWFFALMCSPCFSNAQETQGETEVIEQQLEDMTAANDDVETEDDAYLQQMHHFLKDPINLNYADKGLLEQLQILDPIQIEELLKYRKLLGNFVSIYELQAIPSWNPELIKRIRPYVTVAQKTQMFQSVHERLKNGDHSLLIRTAQILERSKGYLLDSSEANSFYPGSPQKILVRYKYRSGNFLQYGLTAEKDAGEQFFRGAQKQGFDFYSAHFFIRDLGVIKSLAIGDFSVNLGQGLTEWQSLAFNKGSELTNVKRQSDVLRPYNSAGEIEFNRGAGITLQKDNWEMTGFASYRKLDATVVPAQLNSDEFVSSLRTSGYHRTKSESDGKNAEGMFSWGGNIGYSNEKWHVGMNAVHYQFENPIQKADYLYNIYALSGRTAANYSLDYSYTWNNMHVFGEMAIDEHLNKAFVNGLLIHTDSKVAMSFLYRNISKDYESLYSNAFTENTNTVNESGLYSAITVTPNSFLKINAYADFYHFPWLKYRTDAPTSGTEYAVQVFYQPNKRLLFNSRFRYQNKPTNYNPSDLALNPVVGRPEKALRSQLSYSLTKGITIRSRVELLWFDQKGIKPEKGFLSYLDLIYKPTLNRLSGNLRVAIFNTDSYGSRIYAFENDVLYSYSIPVFFDKGYRWYLNIRYKLNREFSIWTRIAQTIYRAKNGIGSGLDTIDGNKKTDIKLEIIYQF
ncbi:MAG: ComEA family DNA-binding protein [Ginsengibacter sp.]